MLIASPTMAGALGSLKILDFSRVLAGPLATMVLADLGAEVTKVERPGSGDDTRSWGPPWDEQGTATYFQSVNRNKGSVALDLASSAGLARARELAAGADVLVENFRPGVMDSLGLGFQEMNRLNPGLVYCSITGFGAGEEGATMPGYDLLVQAPPRRRRARPAGRGGSPLLPARCAREPGECLHDRRAGSCPHGQLASEHRAI
jgi:crotonobetainyl-CoA:carnitine CoA-transferase CaiB-like acyl-CoA transferase